MYGIFNNKYINHMELFSRTIIFFYNKNIAKKFVMNNIIKIF